MGRGAAGLLERSQSIHQRERTYVRIVPCVGFSLRGRSGLLSERIAAHRRPCRYGRAMSETDAILTATGRDNLEDALDWIASGYPVENGTDQHALLEALCAVDAPESASLTDALRRIAREMSASTLDSAAVLFDPELITAPQAFRRALDPVAAKCPDKTLSSITADAVIAAQRKVPETMETLCAVAGLSYSELVTRVPDLPNDPRGRWSPQQVTAAFRPSTMLSTARSPAPWPGRCQSAPTRCFSAPTARLVRGRALQDQRRPLRGPSGSALRRRLMARPPQPHVEPHRSRAGRQRV